MYSLVKNFFKALKEMFMALPMKWRVVIVIVVLALAIRQNIKDNEADAAEAKQEELARNTIKGASGYAASIAKELVSAQLKAPSTADFQNIYEANVSYTPDSLITVVSYVDAQNSFGAKIRNNYIVVLKYKGGDPRNESNFQLKGINMGE